ncbi:hypothetical protein BgiMline_001930 [Biomphalaria glabrata]|nr:hypothetical protein BgiMline_001804 [Biomphalaria glabrata]
MPEIAQHGVELSSLAEQPPFFPVQRCLTGVSGSLAATESDATGAVLRHSNRQRQELEMRQHGVEGMINVLFYQYNGPHYNTSQPKTQLSNPQASHRHPPLESPHPGLILNHQLLSRPFLFL